MVHYRNYEIIGQTLRSLIDQGLSPEQILIVDTSEEPNEHSRLIDAVPSGTKVLFLENRGYGGAVNFGIQYWTHNSREAPRFLLVATHEARCWPGAIEGLREELVRSPAAAAAGPTLVSGDAPHYVWSTGGGMSPRLRIPRHHGHRSAFDYGRIAAERPCEREWLDGAFVLYRWSDIKAEALDETYFLYMEETDLHLRLGAAGRKLLWVPAAIVWQSSEGIPAYYLARNLRLLYRRTGRRSLGSIAVPISVARRAASAVKKGYFLSECRSLLRGLFAGLPARDVGGDHPILVLNTLAAALQHYSVEICSVLEASGASVSTKSIEEPSASGKGRLAWILAYTQSLSAARRIRAKNGNGLLLITWPVLGHLDTVLVALFYRSRAWVVVHDPEPLVRAVGYDRISRWLAKVNRKQTNVIVHSQAALDVLARQGLNGAVARLSHPILLSPEPADSSGPITVPVVRVLGQFKPDRDLEALREIGRRLGQSFKLEIYGRGWPAVPGWTVNEGFLPEDEMTAAIATSDVLVIPYVRFFQSGIAIRGLEHGVPVVGPRQTSLAAIFGSDSKLLVENDSSDPGAAWCGAIEWAVTGGREEALAASRNVLAGTIAEWSAWLHSDALGISSTGSETTWSIERTSR